MELGQRLLVLPANPLGALRNTFMHAAPVIGVVAQPNILSIGHADIRRFVRQP